MPCWAHPGCRALMFSCPCHWNSHHDCEKAWPLCAAVPLSVERGPNSRPWSGWKRAWLLSKQELPLELDLNWEPGRQSDLMPRKQFFPECSDRLRMSGLVVGSGSAPHLDGQAGDLTEEQGVRPGSSEPAWLPVPWTHVVLGWAGRLRCGTLGLKWTLGRVWG